jgi:hypothetical protein
VIGLAVPGRPIRSLVAETAAPKASATGRDRSDTETWWGAGPRRGHERAVNSGQPRSLVVYRYRCSTSLAGHPSRSLRRSIRFHTAEVPFLRVARQGRVAVPGTPDPGATDYQSGELQSASRLRSSRWFQRRSLVPGSGFACGGR